MSSCITSPVIDHRIFEPKTVSFPSCKWSILFQDEMCIFYIMYYDESQNDDDDSVESRMMKDCSSNGKSGRWNNWFRNIPAGADEFRGIVYKESIPKKYVTLPRCVFS